VPEIRALRDDAFIFRALPHIFRAKSIQPPSQKWPVRLCFKLSRVSGLSVFPRDAMLAWVYSCLCLSKVGALSKRIEPVFGRQASIDLSYIVLQRHAAIYKSKGATISNFVVNSRFLKFRRARHIDRRYACCRLDPTKMDT